MNHLIYFLILSIPIIILSWRTLFTVKSHGFYRFFGWELMLWLFISNYKYWFVHPFSITQIFSWILLFLSVYLVLAGMLQMLKTGKPVKSNERKTLFQFEKTTELIDTGIFKYIRHPLYTSLIFLTWGIFLKNPTLILFFVAALSSLFLYLTSIIDEKECIAYFGEKYIEYMKHTTRFIPFLI